MRAAIVRDEGEAGPDDTGAIRRARTDRGAFEPLYLRYCERIYRYLRARTSQEADAADLTQQVFLSALDRLHQYDETRGTFATWLFGIAQHRAHDFHRAHRRQLNVEAALSGVLALVAPDNTEADVVQRDELRSLSAVLANLPEEKREILALRFAGGLTIPEIAVVLGKSSEATRKELRRTIQSLEDHYRDTAP